MGCSSPGAHSPHGEPSKCWAEALGGSLVQCQQVDGDGELQSSEGCGSFQNETLGCHRKVTGHWNGDVVVESLVFKDRLDVALTG